MPLTLEASFPDSPDGVFWAGERLVCTIVVRNEPDPQQTPRPPGRRSSTHTGDLINPFGPGLGTRRSGNLEDASFTDASRNGVPDIAPTASRTGTQGSIGSEASTDVAAPTALDASAAQRRPGILTSVVRSVARGALNVLGLSSSPSEGSETPVEPSPVSVPPVPPAAQSELPLSPVRDPDIPERTSASRILAPAPQHPLIAASPTVIRLEPVNTISQIYREDERRSNSATPVEPSSPAVTDLVTPTSATAPPGAIVGGPVPTPIPTPSRRAPSVAVGTSRTEHLPYGFIQMSGSFHADPAAVSMAPFDTLKSRAMYFPSSGLGHGGGGSLMSNPGNAGKDDRAIPIYSTPPSILFVDLRLEPGETRTYTYSLLLPDVLPPSHRGRLARFSYKLVVGIQRGTMSMRTQNFQVPFRLFSRVEEDFTRPVYDVLDPVVVNTDEARVTCAEENPDSEKSPLAAQEALFDLLRRGYDDDAQSPVDVAEEQERMEYLKHPSLHHAMVACQQNSRVTFDICKNTEHVAQLVLTRTAYRIGDSVVGIIKFHRGTVPCYQISVFLEAMERVQSDFNSAKGPRESRRVLAEHHEFCLNTKRTQVMLPIPTNCTPDFVTTAVTLQYGVRIEFVTGAKDRMATTVHQEGESVVHSHGTPVAEVESFDCTIPIKVFGSSLPKTLSRYLHFTIN